MTSSEPAVPTRDTLILSEERLSAATRRVVAGTARLEKYLVTESKTITVDVVHEEIRLVTVPGEAVGSRTAGKAVTTTDWMVVSREELVVTKKIVPVERVRLEILASTEQRDITDAVRREHLAVDPESRSTNL